MEGRPPSKGDSSTPPTTPKAWNAVVNNSASIQEYQPEMEIANGKVSITIPEAITKNSSPLWKNYVIGHFLGHAPHVGKVHAIVNKIWASEGKQSKIDVNFISNSAALFRIDDDLVRKRVLKRTFCHIAEIPVVVHEWKPENAHKKLDITAIPIWVDFKDVPGHLFSTKGLSYLASVVGRPIRLHPTTERCTRLDVARMLVEVDLSKPLHNHILVKESSGTSKNILISYPWLPPRCEPCSEWGHEQKSCSKTKMGKDTTNAEMKQSGNIEKQSKVVETKIVSPILPATDRSNNDLAINTFGILLQEVEALTGSANVGLNSANEPVPSEIRPIHNTESTELGSTNEWQVVQRSQRAGLSNSPMRNDSYWESQGEKDVMVQDLLDVQEGS